MSNFDSGQSDPTHQMHSRLICIVPDVTHDVQWRNIRGWMQMVLTPNDLFSWNKYDINFNIIDNLITFEYINKPPLRMLTLCTLGHLHHAWLFFSYASCTKLPPSLLGDGCLACFLSGGPGPPSPPSLELAPFPSGPRRQRPTLVSGTCIFYMQEVTEQ